MAQQGGDDFDFFDHLFDDEDDNEPADYLVKAAQPRPDERPPPMAPGFSPQAKDIREFDPLDAAFSSPRQPQRPRGLVNQRRSPGADGPRPQQGPGPGGRGPRRQPQRPRGLVNQQQGPGPGGRRPRQQAKPRPQKKREDTLDLIWISFFNQAFGVTEQAVQQNFITKDDILDEESFLYFGIAGATILDGLMRSLRKEGVELAIGKTITSENCPKEHLRMYEALNSIKQKIVATRLTDEEFEILRKVVLFAQSEDKPAPKHRHKSHENDQRLVLINRCAGAVQSVATEVTQLSFYKAQFDNILSLLQTSLDVSSEDEEKIPQQQHNPFNEHEKFSHNEHLARNSSPKSVNPSSRGSKNKSNFQLDGIWRSFFNRTFEITEHALKVRLITIDEIEDREPFLYFGLVGTTVLDAIIRSLRIKDGISLSAGTIINETNCPPQHVEMYQAFLKIKNTINSLRLNVDEQKYLRKIVLYSQSEDHEIKRLRDPKRDALVNRVAATVQSIATNISQLPFYKKQFDEMLTLVCAMNAC